MVTIALHFGVVVICTGQCVVASRDIQRNLLRLFVFFGVGLIHGVVPMFSPVYEIGQWRSSADSLSSAAPIAFVAAFALAISWTIFVSKARQDPLSEPNRRASGTQSGAILRGLSDSSRLKIALIAGLAGVAGAVGSFSLSAGSLSAYTEGSRFEYRGEGGLAPVLLFYLVSLAFLPGFLAHFFKRTFYRHIALLYALTFAGWYYFATRGTRSIPIGIMGAVLVGYVLSRDRPRLLGARLSVALVLGVVASVGLYAVRSDLGTLSVSGVTERLTTAQTYQGALDTDPLNYHAQLVAAVDLYPGQEDYTAGATYRRILFAPIPGAVAGGVKPGDTHVDFGRSLYGPNSDISVPPSLPGDGYINLVGPVGMAGLMVLWGGLGAMVDRRLSSNGFWLILLGPGLVRLVLLFLRGQPYEVLVLGITASILTCLIAIMSGVALRTLHGASLGEQSDIRSEPGHRPAKGAPRSSASSFSRNSRRVSRFEGR